MTSKPSGHLRRTGARALVPALAASITLLAFNVLTVSANPPATHVNTSASATGAGHGNGNTAAAPVSAVGPATTTTTGNVVPAGPSTPSAPTAPTTKVTAPVTAPATAPAPASPTTPTGSTTGAGAGNLTTPNKTGPGDNNHGDTWLQTVGPCADHNAEVLNHDADAMSGCNLAIPGGNPTFEPPAEPTAESNQKAEIGTVEDVNPDHNPHLPCANIELMGKDMADATGNYSIDYWPPTGDKGGVYGKNSNGSSALSMAGMINGDTDVSNNGTWSYTATPTTLSKQGTKGGYQVMDIIDVSALVHNAQLINPDPQDIQGYHFKLQYTQDPQKHKTFWVKCAAPTPPQDCDGDNNGSLPTDADCQGPVDCDGNHDNSQATDADCQGPVDCDGNHDNSQATDADCQGPPDCDGNHDGSLATDADCTTGTTGVQGASTNTPSSGVLGAAIVNPVTGHPWLSALLAALALVIVGSAMTVVSQLRRRRAD